MEEKEIGAILNEWLLYKREHPKARAEDFALQKYVEFHREEKKDLVDHQAVFYRRAAAWRRSEQQYAAFVGAAVVSEPLEPWQGAEMLDNVISELEMDSAEQYRYLLNVKLLSCYHFLRFVDGDSGERLKQMFDREYETRWARADADVSDGEMQELFADVVSLMRYAGAGYDDETRRILAEIGVGRPAEFTSPSRGEIDRDIRFLTNFLLSEMIFCDREEPFTKEEQELLWEQVIPVCVSAAAMIREGEDAGSVTRQMQAYLGRIFSKKNTKVLAAVAAVFAAAKVLTVLLEPAIVCTVAVVGLHSLWKHCKEKQDIGLPEKEDFLRFFFPGTERQKALEPEREDAWNLTDKEWDDETESEDA